MNIFVVVIFYSFIVSIHADFGIIRQAPNGTIGVDAQQFIIQINQTVNKPVFSAFIHVYNETSNISIYAIDVSNNNSNVTYSNNTLTFYIPQSIYNITNEFYITFDAGVLFSNITNSTAENSSQFWNVKVIDIETTTSITSVLPNTSMGTTNNGMTASSVTYSATSAFITTNITTTYTSTSQTVPNPNTTTTTVVNTNTGEPPPTRSAKLGMGLGILLISIVIIGEIIYFKCCYSGGDARSGSYYT